MNVQERFEAFAKAVPESRDREIAIEAAWDGKRFPSVFWIAFLGLVAAGALITGIVMVSVPTCKENRIHPNCMRMEAGKDGRQKLAAWCLGSGAVLLPCVVLLWRRRRRIIDAQLALKPVGHELLEAVYADLLKMACHKTSESMRKLIGGNVVWEALEHWPQPSGILTFYGEGDEAASFEEPKQHDLVGLFGTDAGLVVVPPAAVEIGEGPTPVANLRKTVSALARSCENIDIDVSNLGTLSAAELYYQEMVMAEYAGGDTISKLNISTRDGRNFSIRARPAVADSVRNSIRASKRPNTEPGN